LPAWRRLPEQKHEMAVDEIERIEPDARRNRRLAASDRTMPPSMMAPSATRLNRSIVHHHAANGVRSTRETILEFPLVAGQFCGRTIRNFVASCANMVATLLRKNFKCLSWVMSPPYAKSPPGPRASRPLFGAT